ncbi:MAG: RNA polymerase sigma factor [Chitinophagales bacterium]|nr:RNA polymerase sigma factor [Chitinophagales bacterium]MDW8273336.1 RNA polymerase sigma factor [Chitinophagales bacterium]
MQISDSQILEMFHSGKREKAFSLLMEKYQERIYWHIRRMVMIHEDADDVMQNTFVKVWNALENFRAESQLYTWLYRIATNEALNHLQIKKKKAAVPFESSSSADQDDDSNFGPSNYLKSDPYFNGDEIELKLQRAIDSLPDKQRQVFLLRYYDEMPYEQMSEILGTSVGALKASYHHAVQKVEAYLMKND